MPSRRPPSQRDPAYAVHRLGATLRQVLPGAPVRNAQVPRPTPVTRVLAPTAGGGALLGYAEVQTDFGNALVGSSPFDATSTSIAATWGSPAISIGGTSGAQLTYNTDSKDCVYIVTANIYTSGTYTNGVASDIYQVSLGDPFANGWTLWNGTSGLSIITVGSYRVNTTMLSGPTFAVNCSGGTNRVMTNVGAYLTISRFAA